MRRGGGLRALWADVSGSSAVEFALLAPMFVALMIGVIEIGLSVRTALQARQAAAAGAAYASKHLYDATAITAAAKAATARTGVTVTPALQCGCPISTGFSTTCAGTCTDGNPARNYAVVTVSIPRRSLFSGRFGLPANMSATATAMPGR